MTSMTETSFIAVSAPHPGPALLCFQSSPGKTLSMRLQPAAPLSTHAIAQLRIHGTGAPMQQKSH